MTNVWRFHDALVDQAPDGTAQVRWYDRGVGTDLGERLRGGAFGVGLSENIREGYRALMNTYEDGDTVYILGFSRGAYSARSLVGLIRKCGLVRRDEAHRLEDAYRLYRRRDPHPDVQDPAVAGGSRLPSEESRRVPGPAPGGLRRLTSGAEMRDTGRLAGTGTGVLPSDSERLNCADKEHTMPHRGLSAIVGTTLAVAAALVPAARATGPLTGLKPAEPQPTAQQLAPGLAVEYVFAVMNHVDELKGKKGEKGTPLPNLDYTMGAGSILTTKATDAVGAVITGLIQFQKPGVYGFDVTSNDGVRVEIGGKLLYEDPVVHADDTSDRIDVKIDRVGWYPITVHYFEKRHTATLILRWIGPGDTGKLAPVPAEAFAHLKK
jgi:T6SS, Phospholipase effector Tle1-like, catalytic domain/PA14 domain